MAKNELRLTRELKFGIELEVTTTRRRLTIVKRLEEAGIAVEGGIEFGHQVVAKWKVVTDSSIEGRGFEIVSPPLKGMEALDEVETVCKVLNDLGATVNKSCGFHVHHEAKDLSKKQIENVYKIYDKYEVNVIDKLLPMSRRIGGNGRKWCKPVGEILPLILECENIAEMMEHRQIGGGRMSNGHYAHCRYRSVNFRSYVAYGTLEFRHHSGTIEFDKIKNWVLLTHKILDAGKNKKDIKPVSDKRMVKWEQEVRHSSYDFYMELGINGTELSEYLGKRRKALKLA